MVSAFFVSEMVCAESCNDTAKKNPVRMLLMVIFIYFVVK
jgi:predicted nucleic acid-binding Zn ribbon protein